MTWNIVSDSSCDMRISNFQSEKVRFEIVPLRIQVGEQEFIDNDSLKIPEMLEAMAAERDDIGQYIDLFGTHPKYGLSGRRISSVSYRPQPYQRTVPLYEAGG